MSALRDPRQAQGFRFVRCAYAGGVAQLAYAFDDGPELVERIVFPDAPALAPERRGAFVAALRLLHLIAGVSYYKVGVPERIVVEGESLDAGTAQLLEQVYRHGLAEFAYQNKLDLRGRQLFLLPPQEGAPPPRAALAAAQPGAHPARGGGAHDASGSDQARSGAEPSHLLGDAEGKNIHLPRRSLVPIGGGKDSLVTVEMLRSAEEPMAAVWVGNSDLIAACAARTGLPTLNIGRQLAAELFEYNRLGAWNGHIPVTAINSAILLCAALLYGYDAVVFSNERSASAATLEYEGRAVNHQWSKSLDFERALRDWIAAHVGAGLDYFSLLRPWSELAVTREFARSTRYDDVFSSCNRNFRIRGERPADRWCGQCPKCHFVFLALAPFVAKPRLLAVFGRNLLDDAGLARGFDALLEYRDHKPFECVGEGLESRAAFAALARRPEWREDALVARFAEEIAPQLGAHGLALDALLEPDRVHFVPARLAALAAGRP